MNTADDVITLTQALLRFNTINPPGDESLCMAFLADYLQRHGFEIHLQRFADRRFNLLARMAGSGRTGKPLAFTGHLDTVPLGNARWRYDAFGGEIDDGKLYGRGASDMKAAIAAFIVACMQRRQAIQAGNQLTLRVNDDLQRLNTQVATFNGVVLEKMAREQSENDAAEALRLRLHAHDRDPYTPMPARDPRY